MGLLLAVLPDAVGEIGKVALVQGGGKLLAEIETAHALGGLLQRRRPLSRLVPRRSSTVNRSPYLLARQHLGHTSAVADRALIY